MKVFTVIGELGASSLAPWREPAVHKYNEAAASTLGWGDKIKVNPNTLQVQLGRSVEFADKSKGITYEDDPVRFTEGVTRWQAAHKLSSDGKIGPGTWRAMQQAFNVNFPAPAQPKPTTTKPAVDPTAEPGPEVPAKGTPWWQNISYPWIIGGGIALIGLVGFFWPSSPKDQRKSGRLDGYSGPRCR